MMKKIDETINTICDWIQTELKDKDFENAEEKGIPEMTEALAKLLFARATYNS